MKAGTGFQQKIAEADSQKADMQAGDGQDVEYAGKLEEGYFYRKPGR